MTLQELQVMFPAKVVKHSWNRPQTGHIPMSFVEANLTELAKIVKDNNLRRFYRGPRRFRLSTTTHRSDAVSMVLYTK